MNFRSILISGFLFLLSLSLTAQEVCDNGLDDDGDGLVDLNDAEDCACALLSQVPSLLPNPSFEEFDGDAEGCFSQQSDGYPDRVAQANCLAGWRQASNGTTDAWNAFTFSGSPPVFPATLPQPLPSGSSCAGIWVGVSETSGQTNPDGSPIEFYREFLGACLEDDQRTQGGENYVAEFFVGFVDDDAQPTPEVRSPTPVELALYGIRNCDQLFFPSADCPENAGAEGWELLTTVTVNGGSGRWTKARMTFQSNGEFAAVALGGKCGQDPGDRPARWRNYYFIDEFRLNTATAFTQEVAGPVAVRGVTVCDEDFALIGPNQLNASFQWYFDGIAIPGATDRIYRPAPADRQDGDYRLRTTTENGCVISDPVRVQRPILPDFFADSVAICNDSVTIFPDFNVLNAEFLWDDGSTEPRRDVFSPGEYAVTITAACLIREERFVVVDSLSSTFRVNLDREPVCPGDTVNIDVSSNWDISFALITNERGFSYPYDAETNSYAVPIDTARTVYITYRDGCGDVIQPYPLPFGSELNLDATLVQPNCQRPLGSISLDIQPQLPGLAITWTDENGQVIGTQQTQINDLLPGTYTVNLSDGINCDLNQSFLLAFEGDFSAAVNLQPENCTLTSTAVADLTNGTPPFTYRWQDADGTPLGGNEARLSNLLPGDYSLTVEDGAGCRLPVAFSVPGRSLLAAGTPTVVVDCTVGGGNLTATAAAGAPPYQFSLDGERFQDSNVFNALPTGSYRVWVRDANGCLARSEAVELGLPVELSLALPVSYATSLGDSVRLRSQVSPTTASTVFSWSPASGLSCTDCPSPTSRPTATTEYTLTVSSPEACPTSITTTVEVDRRSKVYFPTAFSPNGDGINDRFWLFPDNSVAGVAQIQVYDRWGKLVWEAAANEGWDGTANGEPVGAGTYVYAGTLLLVDGRSVRFAGTLVLLR
ncbi:gliding motility-associated C-terminal domain-containing protein [Lewinella sp. W8]|uniref:gliding motility-associated C-terminal domain-containing protein n=1 Tax=Lewinella sp. W8 TaxID=2528208 RepID=UPI00106874E2|nr:gliding motility-associated C-terminal domain-containing protein [Lewinella sp. W8]MTB49972.1 T9SS type B sorting domain-containing protein [Lewinella sp. W8]